MANLELVHPKNVAGGLFVDTTCIDCGTCYHLAPKIFEEAPDQRSFVTSQPVDTHEWSRAKAAMVSCPTNSIGVVDPPAEFKEAEVHLPLLIAENVYYCGYTARSSFGATSYFIERPQGNVLIDCPRFHPTLVKELEAMGGIKSMVLTHRDDVADHAQYAAHFGCSRTMHKDDITKSTMEMEKIIEMDDFFELDHDLKLISTPGHTKGHIVVLYKNRFLFTGDHVFFDQRSMRPVSSKEVCWYSWDQQIGSTRKLLAYDFEWLMPGHGGWGRLDGEKMRSEIRSLIGRMERA